jgi:hypothetical protein
MRNSKCPEKGEWKAQPCSNFLFDFLTGCPSATLLETQRASMAENKTRPTETIVDNFIASLPEGRRADAKALVKLMQSISHQKPKVWGTSIIGFGSYHYRYESGRESDMPLICFSPRKATNVIYNMGSADKSLRDRLGKHALKGGCLHIATLANINVKVLEELVTKSFAKMCAEHSK